VCDARCVTTLFAADGGINLADKPGNSKYSVSALVSALVSLHFLSVKNTCFTCFTLKTSF
jgi:hypothetical protein